MFLSDVYNRISLGRTFLYSIIYLFYFLSLQKKRTFLLSRTPPFFLSILVKNLIFTLFFTNLFDCSTVRGLKRFGSFILWLDFSYIKASVLHTLLFFQGPTHPLYTQSYSYSLQTYGKDTTLSSKQIKVFFCVFFSF